MCQTKSWLVNCGAKVGFFLRVNEYGSKKVLKHKKCGIFGVYSTYFIQKPIPTKKVLPKRFVLIVAVYLLLRRIF